MKLSNHGSSLTKRELLSSEYEELQTYDPEIFFEAMLISLRNNTIAPLDNKRMAYQKVIFKKWFSYYEDHLRKELAKDVERTRVGDEDYKAGKHSGELQALKNLPVKAVARGVMIDMAKVYERIKELEE